MLPGSRLLHELQTGLLAKSGQVFQKAQFKQEADGQIPSRLWKLNKLALQSVTIFDLVSHPPKSIDLTGAEHKENESLLIHFMTVCLINL